MSTIQTEEEQILQAVFSVCVPGEFVSSAMEMLEATPGTVFAGEFQEYITGTRAPHFPTLLTKARLPVALVDCDADPEAALETMERLQQFLPQKVRLIGMSANLESAFLVRAMRAGCNEYLRKPLQKEELSAALRRFQATSAADAPALAQSGQVIAFVGAKGGVGTTTLAVHMAVHLVRTHKKRVLLVDQRQQLGHVALYLGIEQTKYHFDELLRNADRLDAHLLEGLTTRHSAELDVISSPDICSPPYPVSSEDAASVIGFLRHRYDYVLLDSESECTHWLPALLQSCDTVAMVCNPDVAALRDLARQIEHLSLTEGFASKLSVVVNRAGSEPAVAKEDIEHAIRFPVAVEIPNNYIDLVKAVNAGEPIPPTAKGRFTQAVAKWAQTVVGSYETNFRPAPAKRRFSLWG